jgi:ATP-dependent DNA helicase RecG
MNSLQNLQKFIYLEVERAFDNRAVMGGLSRFASTFLKNARSEQLSEELIQSIVTLLSSYDANTIDERKQIVTKVADLIGKDDLVWLVAIRKKLTEVEEKSKNPNHGSTNIEEHSTSQQSQPVRYSYPRNPNPGNDRTTRFGFEAPLTVIPGIGVQKAKALATLGLNSLGDLLYFFPRRYDDFSKLKPINKLVYGDEITVLATIQSSTQHEARSGRMKITEIIVTNYRGR